MKRKWGALLGFLWVQICCELGSSQIGNWGVSTAVSGREGRRADLERLDGPTSSGVSWDSVLVWKPHPWLSSDIIHVASSSFQAGVRGVKVEQSPSVLSLQEGANSTLWCNSSDTVNSVQWFQQNPGGSLITLFFIASGMKQNERLSSTVNSKERYSTLHITASQLEDTATYLCAVEAQCSQVICSLYPNCSCLSPSPAQYYTVQVPLLPLWVSRFIIQHFFLWRSDPLGLSFHFLFCPSSSQKSLMDTNSNMEPLS